MKPEVLLPLHDEVLRLVHLVDELHLLNTAEAGELVLHKEKTDLNLLLVNLMELLQPEADACGVTLRPEYRDSAWAQVDPKRLKQLVLNLLTNALRHTPEGGSISVRIDARDLSGQIAIGITDTGTGIPADALPHVFDRFYRVDSGRGRSTGGSGLGLSIAKQIAAAHGGYIQVQSELGKGTEFTVILPWSDDSSKN
ncbi:sensor histidine kinase [Paenibacillus lautus]